MTRLTVFSHFFNEEFLLPYWLRHHQRLFDHGVLVDRFSTDRSAEIVRELAPGWEVVQSRSPLFDAEDCDLEMMDLERQHEGWKVVLTATEFVFHEDLRGYLADFERRHPTVAAIGVASVNMVDRLQDRGLPVTDDDLFFQRFHGYFDDARSWGRRYVHRGVDGAYGVGRHTTALPSVAVSDLLVLRFSWCPYEHIRERKLHVQSRMPAADRRGIAGWHHYVTPDTLDARFIEETSYAYDLRSIERYRTTLASMHARWGPEITEDRPQPKNTPGVGRDVPRTLPADRRRIACLAADLSDELAPTTRRATHLAAALSQEHDVRLLPMAECDEAMGWADILVVGAAAMRAIPALADSTVPVVVDLDGVAAEALDGAAFAGDFFICGDGTHRALVIGHLAARGQLDPFVGDNDAVLESVMTTIPCTITEMVDAATGSGRFNPPVLLWRGGLENWLDPLTLVHAMAQVRARNQEIRVIFAPEHPFWDLPTHVAGVARHTRALSDQLGLTGSAVVFQDGWTRPDERRRQLARAHAGVTLHGGDLDPTCQPSGAIDYLCCAIPVITTTGDPCTELIQKEGVGITVPVRDPDALATAVLRLFEGDLLESCRKRAARIAPELSARAALDPLLRFCRQPFRSGLAGPPEPPVPASAYRQLYRMTTHLLWTSHDVSAELAACRPTSVNATPTKELARLMVRRLLRRFGIRTEAARAGRASQ